ncbi:MAG: hypothetical protein ABI382_06180 [Nakamurella sp.]
MSEQHSHSSGVDEPAEYDGAPAPPTLNPVRRHVKPRDWVVVAVVAAVAMGLASYMIFRPGGSNEADIAGGATGSSTVVMSSNGALSSEQDDNGATSSGESTATEPTSTPPTSSSSVDESSNPDGIHRRAGRSATGRRRSG